ncbi:MAG: sulfatase-like hydrolase/transferase [Rhodospirillaceae bacterium]|nr:sulfatase-like hydrolase/transferase [Rhodospirillaceae bacterium]MBT4588851.1 sulfatase-like hydrolase/transferase [Rhodospirillaceae bacterium]MBT4939647.1 sulfatase-like hydrolase/transferase [Rhodospirillaceae bacterium]MBT5940969.1 sulfatase-like hydrolase/transferase [Rhodospirillaceae bacterium]MBT7266851.1 sulfatase-like hydrolase/transferase [Rhodospirillaceae bacterium]
MKAILPKKDLITLAEALGAAMLLTVPFWLAAFARIGTPLDQNYMGHMYHNVFGFVHVDYLAAILLILFTALIFWVLVFRNHMDNPILGKIAFTICLLSLAFFANGIRIYFLSWANLTVALEYFWITLILSLVVILGAWRWRHLFFNMLIPLTRIGAVFFLLALINVSIAFIKLQPENMTVYSAAGTNQPAKNKIAPKQVVWIIFDELDERVGFVDRPSSVEMPALDRFRAEAIVATNAEPPGDVTLYSIPTLFQGKYVGTADYTQQDNLRLNFGDGKRALWTESQGIIQKAKSQGMDVALLAQSGHAYCRLFAKYLSSCIENGNLWTAKHRNLFAGIKNVLNSLFEHVPLVYRAMREPHMTIQGTMGEDVYQNFKGNVNRVLADPSYDLIILHWNIPHRPFIYDHLKDKFSDSLDTITGLASGYLGNLELTDLAFSSMRETLEKANLWESSAVIISADHRWREAEKLDGIKSTKVPLMIKLPGHNASKIVSRKVTAINSSKLIWGLLTGEISSAEDAIQVILLRK